MSRAKNARKRAGAGEASGRPVAESVADMPEIQLVLFERDVATTLFAPSSQFVKVAW